MIQMIIGIAALVIFVVIIKNYRDAKALRDKEDELGDLGMKKSIMSVDEEIVSEEISLKERTDDLNEQKEKLNV